MYILNLFYFILYLYNPSFLCFNMVSFRGPKKLGPLPDRSPLWLKFKISNEYPHPFHWGVPPTRKPCLYNMHYAQ